MIIAALYVILLVGFSRESYMRRDAEFLFDPLKGARVVDDAFNRMCRIDPPVCLPASPARMDGVAGLRRPPLFAGASD
jgi:hypothetical protein